MDGQGIPAGMLFVRLQYWIDDNEGRNCIEVIMR